MSREDTFPWWKITFSLLALAFLVAPIWLLISNIKDAGGAQEMSKPFTVSPLINNYDGYHPSLVYSTKNGNTSDLCITFQFLKLDPATTYATFGILIGTTAYGMQQLAQLALAHTKNVTLAISSNSGLDTISRNISISDLASSPATTSCDSKNANSPELKKTAKDLYQNAKVEWRQDIFVLGQPRAFPQDWYELKDTVTVSAKVSAGQEDLPSSVIMMSRNEDLPLDVNNDNSSDANDAKLLEFVIDRPSWVIVYTYVVSAMPLSLLVALIIVQYARKQDAPKLHEIAFGVAATIVAILPLRAVLVPSALSDRLTRLDIVFGTEVILLVALSIIWAIWAPVRPSSDDCRPEPPPKSPAAEPPAPPASTCSS